MNSKIFSIILYALLGVSALLSVLFFVDVVSEGILINWCYFLLGIATLTAVIFPIIGMTQNPKSAKNALIGVVGLVAVIAIAYALAGGEEVYNSNAIMLADSSTSKLSEAGLISFYILGAGAIGVIIFSEIAKIFK